MSDKALRQRCRNLRRTRLRSDRESRTIKLLIWQSYFENGPRPSQRALAREFRVWPSYVCKVQKQATGVGWDARVTLDELADARLFTAKLQAQGVLAPARRRRLYGGEPAASQQARVLSEDERIAETWRKVAEWKRKNPPCCYDTRRRISVPIPR